jgi:hypothetical protein
MEHSPLLRSIGRSPAHKRSTNGQASQPAHNLHAPALSPVVHSVAVKPHALPQSRQTAAVAVDANLLV